MSGLEDRVSALEHDFEHFNSRLVELEEAFEVQIGEVERDVDSWLDLKKQFEVIASAQDAVAAWLRAGE